MTPIKNQRRGRPCATPVERLRARLWYYAVKSRTSHSDYQLDLFFLEKLGRRPEDPQKRARLFETVRLYGTLPSTGKHHKRDFNLIQLVEEEEDIFTSTAEIFNSPYWQLLTKNDYDIAIYNKIAGDAMLRLGLTRLNYDGEDGLRHAMRQSLKKDDIALFTQNNNRHRFYEFSLQDAIQASPPSLDQLTLLGALFREAYLASALEIAIILKNLYCKTLEDYIQQDWLEPVADVLQNIGEGYLIFAHAYHYMIGAEDQAPYDDWPLAVVERPIWHTEYAEALNTFGATAREQSRQTDEPPQIS